MADLGSQKIGSNYQKLLQISSSGEIADGSGSAVSLDITGNISASGNLSVGEYISHIGDTDTYIQFDSGGDQIDIVVGAANMIYLNEGGAGAQADKVTINNDLADIDFQVKGDSDANLFRTDAANDRV